MTSEIPKFMKVPKFTEEYFLTLLKKSFTKVHLKIKTEEEVIKTKKRLFKITENKLTMIAVINYISKNVEEYKYLGDATLKKLFDSLPLLEEGVYECGGILCVPTWQIEKQILEARYLYK